MSKPNEFGDVLDQLEANGGACLYWQLKDIARALAAPKSGACRMVDDLLIHPQAYEESPGESYRMETTADLCADYNLFEARTNLKLGSADEHWDDERLTNEQRAWVRAFSERWDAAVNRELRAGAI